MKLKAIEIEMTLVKSTKNKHVYGAENDIQSLYIDKTSLPSPPPEKISVTVGGA